nr:hypothetical protein [Tanacetum cinerariifolium]
GNTTHTDNSLLEYDSFCFEIEPDQERLINLVKNNIPDDSSNDSLLEEIDLFLSDSSILPGIEHCADDPEGDIHFLDEFLIDHSILSHESFDSNFEDNPLIPRPPPEPPDAETDGVTPDIHPSSSDVQTRKEGDKTENKDKGKSHVVTIIGFRDLNAEFEECTNNSSNGVNPASFSVSTVGHNFINSTNDFSASGPSNTATSPTVANSSSQDASTSSHDSDMPNLEDLTHSDDADDVGAEADDMNGLCSKLQKSAKNQTISTQDQKPERQSQNSKQFSPNNLTIKLNLSKTQVQGPFLPFNQIQIQLNAILKSPGTNCVNFSKLQEGLKLPSAKNSSEDKEHEATPNTELPSTEDIQPLPVQEPPQNSNMHQIIEECCVEASEEQKQKMEDTMLELVKICQEKEFLCITDTSQIFSIHSIAPILSTKEPEHLLSMGYEHLSITPETESDEVTESNAENLLPIPSECEVALEDKRECDVPISENFPVCDNHSDIFSDFKIDDDISIYDDDFENIEYVEASLSDPEIVSVEEENVVQQEEEEDDFEDIEYVEASLSDPEIDIPDDSSNDSLLEEVDLFFSDNSIPPGIENFADDPEGDIRFLEELLIDNSILSHELSDSNFEDNPSIPRRPPKPPDVETDAGEEIPVVMNDDEDVDYSSFIFVI